jgi:hypothetical protein
VNEIGKDISMDGIFMEEKAISHAQYLDLVYSQMGTLYDLLPELPRPNSSSTSTTPAALHVADSVIGTTQSQSHATSSTNSKSASSNVQNAPSPTTPTGKTSEVNVVQSTPAGKNKPKKGRGKNKDLHMISTFPQKLPTSHDPWIVLDPGDHLRFGDSMLLSSVESTYQAIQSATPSTPSLDELSPNPFRVIFPNDEMIMSVIEDTPWDNGHHRSILFLEQHTLENYQWISTPSTVGVISTVPESAHDVFTEGNLSNISHTIPIYIYIKPGIVKNVHIGASCSPDEIVTYTSMFKEFHDIFSWSYKEMPGIDPAIVIHEIKTYLGAKPVRQRLRPVHPHKANPIKLKVEKLLKVGFLYPVALTD